MAIAAPTWEAPLPDQLPELVTLVLPRDDGHSHLAASALALFETDVLPVFLPNQRWFADKDTRLGRVHVVDLVPLGGETDVTLVIVDIGESQRLYFVPVAIVTTSDDERKIPARARLARIRHGARDGYLYDAFAIDGLPLTLLEDVRAARRRPSLNGGEFVAHAAPALATLDFSNPPAVRRLAVEQSNTSVVVGESVMLKGYRRVHSGPQPELEIARFLDAVKYKNTPALLGYVEYEHPDREPTALCILQRFMESQGDGWAVTLTYLERFFVRRNTTDVRQDDADEHALFMQRAHTLGQRTAELHRAFATPIGDPAFEPEPTTDDDVSAWVAQARATAEAALTTLEAGRDRVPPDLRAAADNLLARRDEIMERLSIPPLGAATLLKTRYHGDFHLGQVLVVADDFMIVDFEGEPGRSAEVRRRKSSPLRDVAGMLRSINYAAVAGLRGVTTDRSEDSRAREPLAREWERRSVAAFLGGYRATIAGCAVYPTNPEQAQRLLDLFVLEKAFYEMSYEFANRPAWLSIPFEGIRAILDAGQHAVHAR